MSCSISKSTRKPMKVVHIQTQYVETDACSFKSVVQNLTGKDSTIPESPTPPWLMTIKKEMINNVNDDVPQSRLARMSYANERPSPAAQFVLDSRVENNFHQDHMMGKGGGGTYSFLSRNLSYKEMDRLMKELPPLEDLHKILSFE